MYIDTDSMSSVKYKEKITANEIEYYDLNETVDQNIPINDTLSFKFFRADPRIKCKPPIIYVGISTYRFKKYFSSRILFENDNNSDTCFLCLR